MAICSQHEVDPVCEEVQSILAEFLELDRTVRADIGANLLSHEFRLILQLFNKEGLIVKDAALSSQLSSRAFYELLKRLEQDKVVCSKPHAQDRRAKSIYLCKEFAKRLASELANRGFVRSFPKKPSDAD